MHSCRTRRGVAGDKRRRAPTAAQAAASAAAVAAELAAAGGGGLPGAQACEAGPSVAGVSAGTE